MEKQRLTKKQIKQIKKFQKNKEVESARYLYWAILATGVFMFVYGILSIVLGLVIYPIFAPISLMAIYFVFSWVWKNWKLIMLYVSDINRGKLLLFLNDNTHFSAVHKERLIKWVYPRRKNVRSEVRGELMQRVSEGETLSRKEKKILRKNTVICPQQLVDGFNKAVLINSLIYAHVNIKNLDTFIRDKFDLTDEHMSSFRIKDEIERCRTKNNE